MNNTSILNISQKNLNCDDVLNKLLKCGVKCNVEKNKTVMRDIKTNSFWLENGCKITQTFQTKNEVKNTWKILKETFDLKCAHLTVSGKFDGCVLDWERKSFCE